MFFNYFQKLRGKCKVGKIKKKTGGFLPEEVYAEIYRIVRKLPDYDIVEVGAATGAASIVIAKAMQDSGKKSRLIAVEKCEGGSREKIGDYAANLRLLEDNLRKFKVDDKVVLFPHRIGLKSAQITALIKTGKIAAFIYDADGKIYRDFDLFWPLLIPGGAIIIDDYAKIAASNPVTDIKREMTNILVEKMIEWGLFKKVALIHATIFGIKPINADFSKFDLNLCQEIGCEYQRRFDALGNA